MSSALTSSKPGWVSNSSITESRDTSRAIRKPPNTRADSSDMMIVTIPAPVTVPGRLSGSRPGTP